MGGGWLLGCGGWGEGQGRVSAESPGPQGRPAVLQLWGRGGHHVVSGGLRARGTGRSVHPRAFALPGPLEEDHRLGGLSTRSLSHRFRGGNSKVRVGVWISPEASLPGVWTAVLTVGPLYLSVSRAPFLMRTQS